MTIYICDDERKDIHVNQQKIKSLMKKHKIAGRIRSFLSGKEMLFDLGGESPEADIIYLDIYMPGMQGIEVAKKLRSFNVDCEIVFLTNSKSHMLNGYDVQAFHYIVKNETTEQKFEEIFTNVVKKVQQKQQKVATFTCAGENRTIALNDIQYFAVNDKIITVYYGDDQSFEFYTTLNKLENTFLGNGFVRVHRSYLLAPTYIKKDLGNQVEMANGESLSVGKKYRAALREELKKYTTI